MGVHIKIQQDATVYQNFYFIFIWSSTCFGRHTAHHQEPKTALAASCFAYVKGCWPCSWSGGIHSIRWSILSLTASSNYTANNPSRMHGVSPETRWASYKYEIKVLIHCFILLDFYVNYTCVLWCTDPRTSRYGRCLQVRAKTAALVSRMEGNGNNLCTFHRSSFG
jgi:hypothetical protein